MVVTHTGMLRSRTTHAFPKTPAVLCRIKDIMYGAIYDFVIMCVYVFIENPDGTPPHLEVFPAIGELSGSAWFCEVLCDG